MAQLKRAFVSALAFLLGMSTIAFAGNTADTYLSPVEQDVLNELNSVNQFTIYACTEA